VKIYDVRIKDCVKEIIKEKGQGILWQKEDFAEALNNYSLKYYEECYLINRAMDMGMIDILLFSPHVSISDQIHLLETVSDLSEDELIFIISQMREVINENEWNIEIVNMEETLNEIQDIQSPEAAHAVAMSYFDGLGVDQDYEKAYELFQLAESYGDTTCNYYLGYMNEYGLGTEENKELAKDYYLQGTDNDQCLYALGMLAKKEGKQEEALHYFHESQDGRSFYEEGTIHLKREEIQEARNAFALGCDVYDVNCLDAYGKLLLRDQDEKGLQYVAYAYYFGNSDATEYLGYLYVTGTMIEQNMERGLACLELAASMGNEKAKELEKKYENL
jgi:TPR repeat protein